MIWSLDASELGRSWMWSRKTIAHCVRNEYASRMSELARLAQHEFASQQLLLRAVRKGCRHGAHVVC